jgi:hypothetical protein
MQPFGNLEALRILGNPAEEYAGLAGVGISRYFFRLLIEGELL